MAHHGQGTNVLNVGGEGWVLRKMRWQPANHDVWDELECQLGDVKVTGGSVDELGRAYSSLDRGRSFRAS